MKKNVFILCIATGLWLSGCGKSDATKPPKTKEDSGNIAEQSVENGANSIKQEKVISLPEYPEYEDAESLVANSDAVFSGTVLGMTEEDLKITKDQDAERMPYFVYEIKIDTLYQGKITEDVIKIKHLNTGTENDALAIERGSRYLFLVELYEDVYPSLINANQSYFKMDAAQNKELRKKETGKENQGRNISLDDIMSVLAHCGL